jgi:hypothetical protein
MVLWRYVNRERQLIMDLGGSMRFEEDGRAGVSGMDVLGVFDNRLVYSWRPVFLRE